MDPMPETPQLQIVQLTAAGRGAVATLLVEGPQALGAVQACFQANSGRPLADCDASRLVVGRFGAEPGEQIVVRRRSSRSIELHCHGGRAAVAMIEKALVERGGRAVAWRDWVRDHHHDPITAAAGAALADARTERTAAILLDQYNGALRRAMEEIERAVARGDMQAAREQAGVLLARAEVGRHLVRPWRVVLAGRANVGKSSLINALVGYRRAIVHHVPGTTRDVVTAGAAVDGWPVELSDTAGLYAGDDAPQPSGAELAQQKLAAAELVLLVFDRSVPFSEADRALIEAWPSALVVHNKCDLAPCAGGRPPGLGASALAGRGIESLVGAIAALLVPDCLPPGAAVPFTAGQIEQIEAMLGG